MHLHRIRMKTLTTGRMIRNRRRSKWARPRKSLRMTWLVLIMITKSLVWAGTVMGQVSRLLMGKQTTLPGASTYQCCASGLFLGEIWTKRNLLQRSKFQIAWQKWRSTQLTPLFWRVEQWMVKFTCGIFHRRSLSSQSVKLTNTSTERL